LSVHRDSANKAIVTAKRTSARCGIAIVTILSWFAISNHCVLAVAIAQKAPEKSECPFHSHPSKPEKQKNSGAQPCCKILRAVAPTIAKSWTRSADFADVNLYFEEFALIANSRNASSPLLLDTGPPGTTSFAHLTGSMFAHAPPFRA
jgi:hypothetical protein